MQIKIYADVVLLINFFMDLFIFWITSRLIKKKVSIVRLSLGSLSASLLYCGVLFVPRLRVFYNFFGAVIILALSALITFSPKNIKELLKILFFAHVAAFAVGGTGMALFYFTNISSAIGSMLSFSIGNFSLKLLISSTAIIYIIIKIGSGWINTNITNKKNYCTVRIYFNGIEKQVTALIDTGNSLSDPLTDANVIVVQFNAISDFFPPQAQILFYKDENVSASELYLALSDHLLSKRLRLIPFSSLGTKNGMLLAFKADKTEIFCNDRENIILENTIIGIYNGYLCKNKGYNALISPDSIV